MSSISDTQSCLSIGTTAVDSARHDKRWRHMLRQWKQLGYTRVLGDLELIQVAMPEWANQETWLFRLNDFWQERIPFERYEVDLFIHAIMFVERYKDG